MHTGINYIAGKALRITGFFVRHCFDVLFISSIGLILATMRKCNLSSTMVKVTNSQCLSVPPTIPHHVRINPEWGDCSISVRSVQQATCKKTLRGHHPDYSICKCSMIYEQKFKKYCLMYQEVCVLWKPTHSKSVKLSKHPENGFTVEGACDRIYLYLHLSSTTIPGQ